MEDRSQKEAAEQMNVSRPTLQRMLNEARYKVVEALTIGAALQIKGGTFRVATKSWQCNDCGHLWEIEHGSGQSRPAHCPKCESSAIRLHRMRRHAAYW